MTRPVYPGLLRPMWVCAAWIERPMPTLRTWYRRGRMAPKACHVPTRALLFDLQEVLELDHAAPHKTSRDVTRLDEM